MSEIRIALSKRKLILALIGSIILGALAIQFILKPEEYLSHKYKNLEIIATVGYVSVLFFGLCTIFIFYKYFDKKSGLIIDKNGITDNTNFTSVGLIEWSEIIGIRTQQVMSNKFILIDVLNPEKFIEKSSKFKASLMKINLKTYGTPLSITSNSLNYNFDKLEKLLKREFTKYNNKAKC